MRSALLGIAIVVAGCSSGTKKTGTGTGTSTGTGTGIGTGTGTGTGTQEPVVAMRGAACEPSEDMQGSCADGLFCNPFAPGGYCMSFCGGAGTPCDDGACVETSIGGEFCAASCNDDDDCRKDEGYVCDPTWKGCVLPGFAAPKFASCGEEQDDTGPFGAPHAVSSSAGPGLYHFEPAAALDKDGNVVALWIAGDRMGAPNALGLTRIDKDGNVVETDRRFDVGRDNAFDPWMASDRAGNVHAVWLGFNGGRAPEKDMMIGYARSTDGGATWSVPVAVHAPSDCPDNAPGCLDKPMIAIGPDATRPKDKKAEAIYVFYSASLTGGMHMVVSRDGGKSFSAEPVKVLDGVYGDVAIDGKGGIHVTALNGSREHPYGSPENFVEYTVSRDGGATFAAPTRVSGTDEAVPFFFVNPSLAVDDAGKKVSIGYTNAEWKIVLASQKGATWTRAEMTRPGDCEAAVPNLAGDGKTVHMIWESNGNGGQMSYSDGKKTQQTLSDGFASFSFARHSTKWTGEYQALLVDKKRKLLHAVWSQTVDEGGVPIARIFHARGKLK